MQDSLSPGQIASTSSPASEAKLLPWDTNKTVQGTVIACVDRSSMDARVVAHAQALAKRLQLPLVLAQVLEPANHFEGPQDPVTWGIRRHRCRERLEWLDSQTSTQGTEQILLEGVAADELSAWAAECDVPLLVLASRGEERGAGPGLGSTAQRLLDTAPASLLLVPPMAPDEPFYRRILLALDGSCRAESVLPMVVRLARDHAAEVLVVHVVPQPQFTEIGPLEPEAITLREQLLGRNERVGRTYLERVLRHLRSSGVEARSILLQGDPREGVQRISAEQHANLIVLATHGHTGRADMPCGSVTAYLAAHAATPVLILRNDESRMSNAHRPHQEFCTLPFVQ